jgi:hypothetical protein
MFTALTAVAPRSIAERHVSKVDRMCIKKLNYCDLAFFDVMSVSLRNGKREDKN